MSESCTKGVKEGLFCAVRTAPDSECECGNNYVKNCEPSEPWGKFPQRFTVTVRDKKTKEVVAKYLDAIRKSHEAHHIACVASVTAFIAKDKDLLPIVQNTKWCINDKANMIALPLWPHTIEWYCKLSRASPLRPEILEKSVHGKYVMSSMCEPPFADLPQHDYDHGKYSSEVDAELKNLAARLKKVKGHEQQKEKLKAALDRLVSHFKNELKRRGQRVGGTHAAWNLGMNFRGSEWYMPFSMANDGDVEPRTFPLRDMSDGGKMAEKILAVAEAFWLEGAKIPLPL